MPESTDSQKVGNLKKITVSIGPADAAQDAGSDFQEPSMTFVYGLAAGGLTPFECALAEKTTGDAVRLSVRSGDLNRTFGHLQPPFDTTRNDADDLELQVRIEKIETAEDREIIAAMAAAAECGCDCGCGGQHGAC
jgi:hypothetical protein